MEGLASDGELLWGLAQSANVLVQIDPVAGVPLLSFKIPGRGVIWYDVIIVSGRIFVIGKNTETGQGILEELSTLRPPPDLAPGSGDVIETE
jgi:hypothetical protein